MKENIINFIYKNMPHIDSHGGAFSIYEMDLSSNYIRIKFAGACTSCSNGEYKFIQLKKRIPQEFNEINTVQIEFV